MRSDADPSGGIDLFDFTLMELYRLRKTDEEEIKEIWENFHTLDADGNGIFTRRNASRFGIWQNTTKMGYVCHHICFIYYIICLSVRFFNTNLQNNMMDRVLPYSEK